MDIVRRVAWTLFVTMPALSVCAAEEQKAEARKSTDPFEGINRVVFSFNEATDRYLLRPIAVGYRTITPDPVEGGVARVFANLEEVVNVANDLLQFKISQAGNDAGRFLVNSTLGVAGIFDVAQHVGLEKSEGEDFGQTLGKWGVGEGAYVVLPFFGASSLRDAPGRVVDGFLNPLRKIDHIPSRNQIYSVNIISDRAELLNAEELVHGDKYIFLRDVYLQRREHLINDGQIQDDFGADYGEGYDDDEYSY